MMQSAVEQLSLKDQLSHILEEARMVLPGIQALFGFQLIAVFSEAFGRELSRGERQTHLAAIALTALAIALTVAPAAVHRQSEPKQVSEQLVHICTRLLAWGMVPLMFALVLDFYLVCRVILGDEAPSILLAAGLLILLGLLWFGWPALRRRRA